VLQSQDWGGSSTIKDKPKDRGKAEDKREKTKNRRQGNVPQEGKDAPKRKDAVSSSSEAARPAKMK
jgi:hypothetical protein